MNNSKKDWTDQLPELLEGYTEAEPEGLWDAVRSAMEPERRRVKGAWWFALGAAAAAAVAAIIFIRSAAPSEEVSIASGDLVAEVVAEPETPIIAEETASQEQEKEEQPSEEPEAPIAQEEIVSDVVLEETAPQEPVLEEVIPEKKEPAPEEKIEPAPEKTVIELKKSRRQVPRIQVGVSRTGYLAQAAVSTTSGVGIPSFAVTKADGTTAPGLSMLSRNKTSTTEGTHTQSARLSLTLRVNLTSRWGIETGLVSSTLDSRFSTTVGNSLSETTRSIDYLGIPVYITYNLLEWKSLGLYLCGGPMYEFSVGTSTESRTYIGGTLTGSDVDNSPINDRQLSLNAAAGVQLKLFRRGALFLQGGGSYHFANDDSPESFYTERPFSPNLTVGYRFLF
ncbi:MAG: outer membrane beta-barrel protein [Bacteroidales bacterium]|nr:outer membrane beta-barrel protein [Bacteroidales bacterium]